MTMDSPLLSDLTQLKKTIEEMSKLKGLLVAGDIGIDHYTEGDVERISPEAPVPVLQVQKEWSKLGLAGNVADNLRALQVKTTLCGVVGDDRHADLCEELLEEADISLWGLVRDEGRKTTFKERVTTKTQQICRIDYETTTPILKETIKRFCDRLDQFAGQHEAIIVQDYGKGLINKEVMEHVLSLKKKHGMLVTVDPSRHADPRMYKGADLLKPNLAEAKLLCAALGSHVTAPREMIVFLRDTLEIKEIVLTLGPDGMMILSENAKDVQQIPTLATSVFDVSGAGDTAIALLTTGLTLQLSLAESARLANCGSGVVVGKRGTATVTGAELLDFAGKLFHKNI
jgi:D-glycero-beta-D-manno-heptose-7-phosphate kinase